MQDALFFIETAAVQTKKSSKEKKPAALFNPRTFYFYAAGLLAK